ncbi:MAG: hypothetical protein Kow0010_08160 [Dehalococcoidia bacterium]
MIVERLTFRAKYGHGDDLAALFREMSSVPAFREAGVAAARIYTDATGPMFTVSVEQEFDDWDAYARVRSAQQKAYGSPEFQEWFRKMTEVTDQGERQLFRLEQL